MTGDHLDLDALADLLAGEGSEDDVAHVGACSGCAGRLDELAAADAEVAAALAAVPAPTMPAGLAERLTAALAAEPALTPSAGPPVWAGGAEPTADDEADDSVEADEADVRAGGSRTVTPFPSAGRERRWAPIAAAAALLVAAGTVGGGLLLAGREDRSTDSLAAGGGADRESTATFDDLATSSTGTDYATDGALDASLAGLLEGGATRSGDTAALSGSPPEAAEAPTAGETGADSADTSFGAGALDRLRDPAELAGCVSGLLPPDDPSVQPVAVDYAAYGGQPALVVVMPAPGLPDKVDVFVVGAECRAGDDRTLLFTRLDRP